MSQSDWAEWSCGVACAARVDVPIRPAGAELLLARVDVPIQPVVCVCIFFLFGCLVMIFQEHNFVFLLLYQ